MRDMRDMRSCEGLLCESLRVTLMRTLTRVPHIRVRDTRVLWCTLESILSSWEYTLKLSLKRHASLVIYSREYLLSQEYTLVLYSWEYDSYSGLSRESLRATLIRVTQDYITLMRFTLRDSHERPSTLYHSRDSHESHSRLSHTHKRDSYVSHSERLTWESLTWSHVVHVSQDSESHSERLTWASLTWSHESHSHMRVSKSRACLSRLWESLWQTASLKWLHESHFHESLSESCMSLKTLVSLMSLMTHITRIFLSPLSCHVTHKWVV